MSNSITIRTKLRIEIANKIVFFAHPPRKKQNMLANSPNWSLNACNILPATVLFKLLRACKVHAPNSVAFS